MSSSDPGGLTGVLISLASLSMLPIRVSTRPLKPEGSGSAQQENVLAVRDSGLWAFVKWALQCWEKSAFCSVRRMADEGHGDRGE